MQIHTSRNKDLFPVQQITSHYDKCYKERVKNRLVVQTTS